MPGITERELLEALAPVKAYFHGSKVTPGTVLAAYLRASGLSAGGDDWQLAKAAFDAGLSFQEAVEQATSSVPTRGISWTSGARKLPNALQGEASPGHGSATETSPSKEAQTGGFHVVAPNQTVPSFRNSFEHQSDPSLEEVALAWFPKVAGPGDITGDGAKKLLGQPKLSPVALLVRETAQNSWDARLAESVDFTINLRCLSLEQKDILRNRVFTGQPEALGLPASLAKDELWVIEVSDRGTKGLGGPTRNDLPIDPLEPTDFIDFIFNIGAPRDVHLGGGTYGFGKTVGYILSQCGTTLVWSRCKSATGVEDRLIGSAIGSGYEDASHRYTGRHWWGSMPKDRQGIEPFVGSQAASIAKTVFSQGFEEHETGTSILIIDPRIDAESAEEYAAKIAEAALWNLWPKLVPAPGRLSPMRIDVKLNGVSVPLPPPSTHPVLGAYVQCLQAVRAAQSGESFEFPFGILEEVWSQRPRKLLGHLALTRFALFENDEFTPSEVRPLVDGSHHVCLMRHAAELVVKYDEGWALDEPGYHWAGVFRPVETSDDSFAMSEPPAHDDWVADSLVNRYQKSEVRVAFKRLKEFIRSFTSPVPLEIDRADELPLASTVGLAEALGSFVASLGGIPEQLDEGDKGGGRGRRTKATKPSVTVLEHRLVASPSPAAVRAVLHLMAQSPDGTAVGLVAEVRAATDGGQESLGSSPVELVWSPKNLPTATASGFTYTALAGQETILYVDFPQGIAVDVEVKVAAPNAR